MSKPNSQPLISFLTVNYNQAEVTVDLVKSLGQLNYQNWECIVVDNGSKPNNLKKELSVFEKVTFVLSKENLGFAGGNNLGLPYCKGEFVFFVNNDTEVPSDFLDELVPFAQSKKNLGALSPKIEYYHQPKIVQYAGANAMNKLTIRNSTIGNKQQDAPQYSAVQQTFYAHGAAMLISRNVLEKVGPMYTDYFLYYEEYDWCERIRKEGFEIWYFGKATIRHKESVSTGQNSPLKIYYLTRNRLLFARRNYSKITVLFNYLYFTFFALPKNVIVFCLKGEFKLAQAFLEGYLFNFTHKSKPFKV